MDAEIKRKRANLEALRRRKYEAELNPHVSMSDMLALIKAVDAEERELNGQSVPGQVGWEHFLKGFIMRRPTWFEPEQISWASDRRTGGRRVEERRVEVEEWDGAETGI